MSLPLKPPVKPQLARSRPELPEGDEWSYEPKWDGFRAIAFVDGDEVSLQSRNGKPLRRYFPEVEFPKGRYVLDGELVIVGKKGSQDFDALQNRLHPAESRIKKLAAETPAAFAAFDLLALDDDSWMDRPFKERRAKLESKFGKRLQLTPTTRDTAEAGKWLHSAEGVVAKELGAPYLPGERHGMAKIKRVRTIDAVVAGWRPGKEKGTIGSLMLGLYDKEGELHVIGHTSGLKAAEKRELRKKLKPFESGEKGSADPSRWSADRDLEWVALRPELVVEVSFDHVSAGRIRHGSKIERWREDKPPAECKLEQLDS
jgi:ATP-dependent DNA ligase